MIFLPFYHKTEISKTAVGWLSKGLGMSFESVMLKCKFLHH